MTSISSITISFPNDKYVPTSCDRNLVVDEATFSSSDLANIMARPFNASSPWNIPLPKTQLYGAAPNYAGEYGAYVTDQTVGSTGFGVDPNTVPVALTGALNSQPTWTNSDMVKLTGALRLLQ